MYCDNNNFTYLKCLYPILEEIQKANKSFESNTADPSKLLTDLTSIVRSIAKRFINPQCRLNPLTANVDSYTMNNVYFGYEFEQILLSSKSSEDSKQQLKQRCLKFLQFLLKQLQQRVPKNIDVLEKVNLISIKNALQYIKDPLTPLAELFNFDVLDKKHIDTFYNYESKCNVRMAPKLTYAHVHPGPFEKMKVRLAAQIFSHSVAAGMSVALNQGILPTTSKCTINFINFMDRLFDIFNSSDTSNSKIYNNPFKNEKHQKDHLTIMEKILKNMKVIHKFNGFDVTKKVNFINGWLISISGLKMLWNSLNPEQNEEYTLRTGRINQDCLENLFGTFRQQHGNNYSPTPIQFIWVFKKIFCLEYFKHSPSANYIEDIDKVLYKVKELNNLSPSLQEILNPKQTNNPFKFTPITIGTVEYRKLNIPETNALTYICGLFNEKMFRQTCLSRLYKLC